MGLKIDTVAFFEKDDKTMVDLSEGFVYKIKIKPRPLMVKNRFASMDIISKSDTTVPETFIGKIINVDHSSLKFLMDCSSNYSSNTTWIYFFEVIDLELLGDQLDGE